MKSHSAHRIPHTEPLIIKVCGITQVKNLEALTGLPIDWFGFIRYPQSKRFVDETDIIHQKLPQKKVGVFVDAPLEEVLEFIRSYPIDLVQLHGNESPDYCEQLRKSGLIIIKAFSVNDNFDFNSCDEYANVSDFFLFDTKGKMPGRQWSTIPVGSFRKI
jgi:phosphoribosylanthranilate isomerase